MTKKLTKYDYKIADYCTRKKPRSIFTISRNMDNQNSAWYNFNDANKYIPVEPNFLPVFDTDDYLTTNCGTHNRRNSTTAIEKKSKKKRFDHERFKTFRKTRSANRIQDQAQLRSNSYYELSGFVEQTRTEVKNNKLQNCRGGQKKRHRQRRRFDDQTSFHLWKRHAAHRSIDNRAFPYFSIRSFYLYSNFYTLFQW